MGTSNHCLHGKRATVIETILDWRPFDYYTYDSRESNRPEPMVVVTHEIAPTPTGARLSARMKVLGPGPDVMKRVLARVMASRYHIADDYRRLAQLAVA